jgi:3-(3-hydroxy-phenyl)propionate hydroxylase
MSRIFEEPLYPYAPNRDQDPRSARRHRVAIVGAGPVGLALAIDLARQGVETVVVDDNDKVSWGSRAICFAKRPLEILDRLGCGEPMVEKGVVWNLGKVFFGDRQVYDFNLLPEEGHRRPAFINLQQYHFEKFLLDRLQALVGACAPVELRGGNKVVSIDSRADGATLQVETPDGIYPLEADWVIACDGASSPIRRMLGLDFVGRVFEDNFLIADVRMAKEFPTERWFWFDPPFNRGQSALLHKQPDGVWRIDLQLGWNIDRQAELEPERVIARLRQMLGEDTEIEIEWMSIYTFQCRRMERFRHGRTLFAGDSAHQVSPFGARGANSGLQDADNLGWKLGMVLAGTAPEALLDSYDAERIPSTDENILNSTRATDFITPKSETSRLFRDAVLDLSERFTFPRPMVNSGRLSVPSVYDGSPLNGPDALAGIAPARSRPGAPCPDAPIDGGFLLDRLGDAFKLLLLNAEAPRAAGDAPPLDQVRLDVAPGSLLADRCLGDAPAAVYLIRPDQHVAARWPSHDPAAVASAVATATARSRA